MTNFLNPGCDRNHFTRIIDKSQKKYNNKDPNKKKLKIDIAPVLKKIKDQKGKPRLQNFDIYIKTFERINKPCNFRARKIKSMNKIIIPIQVLRLVQAFERLTSLAAWQYIKHFLFRGSTTIYRPAAEITYSPRVLFHNREIH